MVKLILKNAILLIVLVMVSLTACNQADDLTTENAVTDFVDQALFSLQETGDIGRYGCYELVFPVAITFPDASVVVADDYDGLAAAITVWKEANPDAAERPTFVFPIEVLSMEGELISVADKAELKELKKACGGGYFGRNGHRGHRGKCGLCFDLVFPVELLFPDGTTATADDRAALKTLVREWKEANPDAAERPTLVFPVNVVLEDGTEVSVGSLEDLQALKESCEGT